MRRVLIVFLALFAVVSAQAQKPDVGGVWYGTLGPASDDFGIVVKLDTKGGGIWTGTMELAQNGKGIPLANITNEGLKISFSLAGVQGNPTFNGALSEDGLAIEGDFTQENVRLPFKLGRNPDGPAPPNPFNDGYIRELIDQLSSFPAPLSDRPFVAPLNHPAIEYGIRPRRDPVAELNRRIEEGKVELEFQGQQGYLRSLLEALNIPIESQFAVFSKTSLQGQRIGPGNPRTIFFNDSVAVGWVRGGFIEVAAHDPQQGVNFYMLGPERQVKPQLLSPDACLRCHISRNSLDVPGMLVRSVFTDAEGTTMNQFGTFLSDHRSPLAERWGGLYVTGTHGSMRHMGNAKVSDRNAPEAMVTDETLNMKTLAGKFDTSAYLSPHSDIVALMVFDHQMHLTNLITRVGFDFRIASFLEEATRKTTDKIEQQLRASVGDLVDYLLFVEEAPLTAKLAGTSGFTEKFAAQGPKDSKGRSLREFDLERRMMRYPCSYMIYTEAFDGLPEKAKTAVYQRMWEVLSGQEKDKKYARLSAEDRRAIVEVLRDTKKGLPDYFKF
jgi:hypothetical protein